MLFICLKSKVQVKRIAKASRYKSLAANQHRKSQNQQQQQQQQHQQQQQQQQQQLKKLLLKSCF
jgi:hypothetical protein